MPRQSSKARKAEQLIRSKFWPCACLANWHLANRHRAKKVYLVRKQKKRQKQEKLGRKL
jgi:hypothetical protein